MTLLKLLSALSMVVFIFACSDSNDSNGAAQQNSPPTSEPSTIYKHQFESLGKAKNVQSVLDAGAERRAQSLKAQE